MNYQVLTFKDTTSNIGKTLGEHLKDGWTIERADVIGKQVVYVLYKP